MNDTPVSVPHPRLFELHLSPEVRAYYIANGFRFPHVEPTGMDEEDLPTEDE